MRFAFILALSAFAFAIHAKPLVFVSLPPQQWLTEKLAGDAVEVRSLLSAGSNPHTFEPKGSQMRDLSRASLYLTIGMTFEEPLLHSARAINPNLACVGMDAGVEKIADSDGDGGDPHIWLSPPLCKKMAENAATALRKLGVEPRLEETLKELSELDVQVAATLVDAPSKVFAVYHPSWCYFAKHYGLELLEIEQDGKAPSARQLADLVRRGKSLGLKIVFAEPQHDERPSRLFADAIGAALAKINPLEKDLPATLLSAARTLAGK